MPMLCIYSLFAACMNKCDPQSAYSILLLLMNTWGGHTEPIASHSPDHSTSICPIRFDSIDPKKKKRLKIQRHLKLPSVRATMNYWNFYPSLSILPGTWLAWLDGDYGTQQDFEHLSRFFFLIDSKVSSKKHSWDGNFKNHSWNLWIFISYLSVYVSYLFICSLTLQNKIFILSRNSNGLHSLWILCH